MLTSTWRPYPRTAGPTVTRTLAEFLSSLFTSNVEGYRQALARLVPEGVDYRVEVVGRSLAQLTAIKDEIWTTRAALLTAGIEVTLAGIDPEANAVIVGVRRIGPETIATLTARFGQVLVREEEPAEPDACTDRFNCWPPKGGTRIEIVYNGEWEQCTSGFVVRRTDLATDALYMMTAGHCIEELGGVSVDRKWYHDGLYVGYSAAETWEQNAMATRG